MSITFRNYATDSHLVGIAEASGAKYSTEASTEASTGSRFDMLEKLWQLQESFGSKFNNFNSIKRSKTKRQRKTMEFIDHTIEELVELRREMPIRKDWSKKKLSEPIWEQALMEYADALHFFISIALVNGWTAEDVFKAYKKKNSMNHTRLNEAHQ